MRNLKLFMFLIVRLLLVTAGKSQDPSNQNDFDSSVTWVMLTESDVLVASITANVAHSYQA